MKKKIMLIVPMLHQGGFERVCVATARLLEPHFDVCIVMFDSRDIAYDIKGLDVTDLHMGVRPGKLAKVFNVIKRSMAEKREGNRYCLQLWPFRQYGQCVFENGSKNMGGNPQLYGHG